MLKRHTGGVQPTNPPRIAARGSDFLAVAVVAAFGLVPFPDEMFRVRGLLLVLALLPAALMPLRRRWPVAVLGLSLACNVAIALTGVLSPSALLAVAIAAYSVAGSRRRMAGIPCVAAAAAVVFAVNAVPMGGNWFDSRALQFVMFIVLAGALGDAARSRREYIAAVTERAERAERGRDEEARRRVAEERVRIARDLHDLVAHQISVISLSAGVASSALETKPERAREALTAIRGASRTVLADIGALMALLRSDDADGQRDLRPQEGLAGLADLVGSFGQVGLRVEVIGDPGGMALSPATDLVAYLALQEGLTNAHKHGTGGRATVAVGSADGTAILTVANPLRAGNTQLVPGGHGLRGLRERVSAVRGQVQASCSEGEFRLVISLPIDGGEGQ